MKVLPQHPGPACDHRRVAALYRDLGRDLLRYPGGTGGTVARLSLLATPQLLTTAVHRVSHLLFARGARRTAQLLAWLNLYAHKAAISPASCLGGGLYLPCPAGVTFHGCAGAGLTLYARSVCSAGGAAFVEALERAPYLGDEVSIGAQGGVLGPVAVGSRVKVAFNVVLLEDAPAGRRVVSRNMRTRSAPRPEAIGDQDGAPS